MISTNSKSSSHLVVSRPRPLMPLPLLLLLATTTSAFTTVVQPQVSSSRRTKGVHATSTSLLNAPKSEDDIADDGEGANLASELFRMAQQKGINLNQEDLLEEEDEEEDEDDSDDEDEDEEEDINIPQGAINAFLGFDTGDVGDKLSGNVSLTDNQLYSEVRDRVLDTAGGFVELVKGASDTDDDDEDDDDELEEKPKEYKPPTIVPDPELTAGEVVLCVLEALNNNDNPTPNRGVEILFDYSSPSSTIMQDKGLTVEEYAEFMRTSEYKVLFDHQQVSIDKGDYSFNGKKAFFTARLRVGPNPATDIVPVNFILRSEGITDDSCWLIDSMLIRPEGMRRRRRR